MSSLGDKRPPNNLVERTGPEPRAAGRSRARWAGRFHDTRHHFASRFMMRGGSLQELKEILGHADITMTLRDAHLSPAHLRSAMLKTGRTSAQEVVGVLVASRK
jgi:integrase